MTPAERQYRRVLRLLPAGYRDRWEEDMVSAYLDSVADSPRRSVGERLAVMWLALRLRLNGSHASPRTRLWYQLALGFALLTTLYESLRATVTFALVVVAYARYNLVLDWSNQIAYWLGAASLVWVATFVCLVLGRVAATRVLVLVALANELGLTALIAVYTIDPSLWLGQPATLREHSDINQAWLGLTAVAVFLVPRDLRPSRGWLAAYAVPALVITPIVVASALAPDEPIRPLWLQLLQMLNVGTFLHAGLIVGMVAALVRARRWLLPLAVFGGGVATVQLLGDYYGTDFLYELRQHGSELWTWVNVVQLALATVCAVAGFVAVRRAGTGDRPATG